MLTGAGDGVLEANGLIRMLSMLAGGGPRGSLGIPIPRGLAMGPRGQDPLRHVAHGGVPFSGRWGLDAVDGPAPAVRRRQKYARLMTWSLWTGERLGGDDLMAINMRDLEPVATARILEPVDDCRVLCCTPRILADSRALSLPLRSRASVASATESGVGATP